MVDSDPPDRTVRQVTYNDKVARLIAECRILGNYSDEAEVFCVAIYLLHNVLAARLKGKEVVVRKKLAP